MTGPKEDLSTRPISSQKPAHPGPVQAIELVVVAGVDRGRRFVFTPPTMCIGTRDDCDVVLTDDTVSKRHALIERRPEGFVVADMRSTNGIWLDEARIKEAVLAPGATFRIGSSVIRLEPPGPASDDSGAPESFGRLVGDGRRMREVFGLLARAAATDLTVLVLGETGTGKEVVAQALHDASPRAAGPFVVFDCSAVSAELMESALFGHHEGAFTGATARRKGAFAAADRGTLFIDEIGELALALQPKLLRALEKREVQPLGADRPVRADARVIAATHRDLRRMVAAREFRQDLFYRLSVLEVALPPLRERREDIPLLIAHMLEAAKAPGHAITPAALQRLVEHDWPGNVRELRNAVERALAMAAGAPLDARHLALAGRAAPAEAPSTGGARSLESIEVEAIRDTLARTSGNRTQAAKILGIDRKTLIGKIQRYKLES